MTATFKVIGGKINSVDKWGSKRIDFDCLSDFWSKFDGGDRKGVYVFGYRSGRGWKPLYVGQTKRQNFSKRIYQHVHARSFDRYLKGIKRGSPYLLLIARVGKGRSSRDAINTLEIEWINYCFEKNENLHNRRGIKKPTYVVQGFGQGGGRRPAVKELKKMIGW